jgi:hypothetical protein
MKSVSINMRILQCPLIYDVETSTHLLVNVTSVYITRHGSQVNPQFCEEAIDKSRGKDYTKEDKNFPHALCLNMRSKTGLFHVTQPSAISM